MADTKRDLLKAIKYFLDEAIVLPPGQLEDPNLLRSIQSFQKEVTKKKMEHMKKYYTVYIGFCDQPPSQGSRSQNPMEVAKSSGFPLGIATR